MCGAQYRKFLRTSEAQSAFSQRLAGQRLDDAIRELVIQRTASRYLVRGSVWSAASMSISPANSGLIALRSTAAIDRRDRRNDVREEI